MADLLPLDPDSDLVLFISTKLLFRGSIVNGEAGCMVCNQPRVLKVLFPVGKGYELKLYEPP